MPQQCQGIKVDGGRCSRHQVENGFCRLHNTVNIRRNERREAEVIWFEISDEIWTNGVTTAAPLVQRVNYAPNLTEDWRTRIIHRIYQDLQLVREIHGMELPTHNAAPVSELQRLASDSQNVHTGPVVEQTRENEEILLSTSIPAGMDILEELKQTVKQKRICKDVTRWYGMKMCRAPNDYLYRKLLNGLWIRINKSEHKVELIKRLVEELDESVKMCCEGHISRLCNVLVGFDDAFKSVVSTGELIQQKLAAIAQKDVQVEYKVEEAWHVFEELGVPIEERMPWIDAF